ncbi:MAG TPA: ATP-binding protein [Saprospiraceae bacterium]|nr:ATP-binding protein [Lewinellaceae bacterium]HQU58836.1 ATP-binding protein [Saprospiraceae bacterium]
MLIEFSVGNFLSFKETVTFSLEAAAISEFPENTFEQGRYRLLKSAVVYGANSSGKSNLMRAISVMRQIVKSSASMSSTDELDVVPFLLSTETQDRPCFFEVLFLIDGIRYRYGFELTRAAVATEWLYYSKAKAEKPLFIRDGEAIEVQGKFEEGQGLEPKTRDNALFLGVVDQFNGPTAKKVMNWFTKLGAVSGLSHENYRGITFSLLNDESCQPAILEFLDKLDLGFDEVQAFEEDFDPARLPKNTPSELIHRLMSDLKGRKMLQFKTIHDIYDATGKKVGKREFDLDSQESSGTNKVFDLLGPVFDTLMSGRVLVIDELNAKLHPLLTRALVALFNSKENNPNNAQLIFSTHDTNLLYYGNFRRDQIYFVEKNRQEATDLYSLVEYKEDGGTVRKDRSFEKDYILGKYGAIPYLGDFSQLFPKWQEKQKSPTT